MRIIRSYVTAPGHIVKAVDRLIHFKYLLFLFFPFFETTTLAALLNIFPLFFLKVVCSTVLCAFRDLLMSSPGHYSAILHHSFETDRPLVIFFFDRCVSEFAYMVN